MNDLLPRGSACDPVLIQENDIRPALFRQVIGGGITDDPTWNKSMSETTHKLYLINISWVLDSNV